MAGFARQSETIIFSFFSANQRILNAKQYLRRTESIRTVGFGVFCVSTRFGDFESESYALSKECRRWVGWFWGVRAWWIN